MTNEADLRGYATALEHLRPGGVAVFEPDHVREQSRSAPTMAVRTGRRCPTVVRDRPFAISSGPPTRIRPDSTYQVEYAVLTRGVGVRVRHDQHVEGLFPTSTWLGAHDRRRVAGRRCRRPQGRVAFVGSRPFPDGPQRFRLPDLDG